MLIEDLGIGQNVYFMTAFFVISDTAIVCKKNFFFFLQCGQLGPNIGKTARLKTTVTLCYFQGLIKVWTMFWV